MLVEREALPGGLVLLAREALDRDARTLEQRPQIDRFDRHAAQVDQRVRGREHALGRRRYVQLAVPAPAHEVDDGLLAGAAAALHLIAQARRGRPAAVQRRHDEDHAGDAWIVDRGVDRATDRLDGGRQRGAQRRHEASERAHRLDELEHPRADRDLHPQLARRARASCEAEWIERQTGDVSREAEYGGEHPRV